MPYGHRVGTNKIRKDPPIATIYIDFLLQWRGVCDPRSLICPSHDITSSVRPISNHGLSESCITDETIVNVQEFSFLAFLFDLIRDEVLVIPCALGSTSSSSHSSVFPAAGVDLS